MSNDKRVKAVVSGHFDESPVAPAKGAAEATANGTASKKATDAEITGYEVVI